MKQFGKWNILKIIFFSHFKRVKNALINIKKKKYT